MLSGGVVVVAEAEVDRVTGAVSSTVEVTSLDDDAPRDIDVEVLVREILVSDGGNDTLELTEDAVNDGTTSDAKLRRDRSRTTGPHVPMSLFW